MLIQNEGAEPDMTTFDRDDLLFQLFDVAGLESLLDKERFDLDRTGVEAILDTAAQIATDHFVDGGKVLDENEPEYVGGKVVMHDIVKCGVDAHREAGFIAAGFDEADGGMGLPATVHQAASFIFSTANVSFGGYAMLTIGAGRLIAAFGSDEQKARWLAPMVEGRFFGTMALSEPHAGSNLADITTKAEPLEDGRYRITGRKMWISGGDHELSDNIVHMVLAKIPGGPAGVKGISLFVVPKYRLDADGKPTVRNDVTLAGLNHKMGYRGITNTLLNFGDNGDCIGELVGAPHHGLKYMFQMMNEARIGVGMGAVALGQAGYQASLAYAKERPQGRHPGEKDPGSPQIMLVEHADVRRLLLAQKAAVEPALALGIYCARLVDEIETADDPDVREESQLVLDMLTPIAKSWPSEFCLEANKHAIQVLGGAGYTRDYPVERYYRDNRLNPIHEGTHGIQGMDLLGRKVVMDNGAGFMALIRRIRSDLERAVRVDACRDLAARVGQAMDELERVTAALVSELMKDPKRGLANATLYLDFMGHVVMAWMWVRITMAAERKRSREGDSAFIRGKFQAARYFMNRELARTKVWAETLERNDQSAFDMAVEGF